MMFRVCNKPAAAFEAVGSAKLSCTDIWAMANARNTASAFRDFLRGRIMFDGSFKVTWLVSVERHGRKSVYFPSQ
jgi:hypothetical protein